MKYIFIIVFTILYIANVALAHRAGWNSGIKCIEEANGNAEHIRQCKE